MKKTLSLILVFLLLFCLCACSDENTQATDPSTQATNSTGEQKPDPTTCSHNFLDATCTTPKTCTKCGATEGFVAPHSYTHGVCSACGTADPAYKKLTDGVWVNDKVIDTLWFGDPYFEHIQYAKESMDEYIASINSLKTTYGDSWKEHISGEDHAIVEFNSVRHFTQKGFTYGGGEYREKDGIITYANSDAAIFTRLDGDKLVVARDCEFGKAGTVYTWVASLKITKIPAGTELSNK